MFGACRLMSVHGLPNKQRARWVHRDQRLSGDLIRLFEEGWVYLSLDRMMLSQLEKTAVLQGDALSWDNAKALGE